MGNILHTQHISSLVICLIVQHKIYEKADYFASQKILNESL